MSYWSGSRDNCPKCKASTVSECDDLRVCEICGNRWTAALPGPTLAKPASPVAITNSWSCCGTSHANSPLGIDSCRSCGQVWLRSGHQWVKMMPQPVPQNVPAQPVQTVQGPSSTGPSPMPPGWTQSRKIPCCGINIVGYSNDVPGNTFHCTCGKRLIIDSTWNWRILA